MEFLVNWLKEAEFSALTIQIAQIVIPVLTAYILTLTVQAVRWISAQLKANMTLAQLNVLNMLADIAVDAAKTWLKENNIVLSDAGDAAPETLAKFNARAIQEFEGLRQQHNLPMVDTLMTRALVSHSLERNRLLTVLETPVVKVEDN